MPSWRQGIAVGEWRQIAATAISSAPMAVQTYPGVGYTGPASKVVAWAGFAVDTRDSSIYSPANGGHMDYAGNEVNRLRLSDNAPAWTEPRAATPAGQTVQNTSHYADGRPTSRHNYYGAMVNEQRNRTMVFSGARWGDGGSLFNLDGFNLASNDWDGARTYPDGPGADLGPYNGWGTVANKANGDFYVFASFKVLRWNNASNTWSRLLSNAPMYGQYSATAIDTKRNRVLVLGGDSGDQAYFDLATNTATRIALSGAQAGAVMGSGNGMVYDPLLDAYLLRTEAAGGTIYRIDPATFAVSVLAVTNGSQIPPSTNGVWTRFLYVPKLKGVIYFPAFSSNAWFVRTY
jgi:hypothetical protein